MKIKNITRKIAVMVLAATMSLGLLACGGKDKKDNSAPDNENTAEVSAETSNIDEKTDAIEEKNGKEKEGIAPLRAKTVHVSTVEEFLEAIAPDTEVVLESGTYNLTRDMDITSEEEFGKWEASHDYVSLYSIFDGFEMQVSDVKGLSIVAAPNSIVRLVTDPRHADVMRFSSCSDIYIEGMTVGHTSGNSSCEGDVLEFVYCDDVHLVGMDLYGCGTYGISFLDVNNLKMENSIIRECSYGMIEGDNGSRFQFTNCEFRDCDGYSMIETRETEAEFIKCKFEENNFDWGFLPNSRYINDLTFTECEFGLSEALSLIEQKESGNKNFSTENCIFPEESKFPYTDDEGYIHVNTVAQLMEAIKPNAHIMLESGYYNISDYVSYEIEDIDRWNSLHSYLYFEDVYDGWELNITNANGLSIESASHNRNDVEIVTDTRYAAIFSFIESNEVCLYNMTIGHTVGSECAGNVIDYHNCTYPYLEGMDLYGCGVYGIGAYDVDRLVAVLTRIHDCSDGPLYFESVGGGSRFEKCIFEGNRGWISFRYINDPVVFNRCSFGQMESMSIRELSDTEVKLVECELEEVNEYYMYD